MMKKITIVVAVMCLFTLWAGAAVPDQGARISKEVRHKLVTLPDYGVFDNVAYRLASDGTVTLEGQVTRPTVREDANNVLKDIEGVTEVVNNIEVLPLAPDDDRLRLALYKAIYGSPGLDRYALQAVPSIHIVVKNGNVVLEGTAETQADKDTAVVRANTVPGLFSVKNNLLVEEK